MKKIRVGQIGIGGFGKKILSKLENISDVSVEWVYGSKAQMSFTMNKQNTS